MTGECRAGSCGCRRDTRAVGRHVGFEFVPLVVIAVVQAWPPVGVGGHHVVGSVDRVAVVDGSDGNRTVSTGRRRDALGAVVAHGDYTDNTGVSGVVNQSGLCARTVVTLVVGVQGTAQGAERHRGDVNTTTGLVVTPVGVFVVDHPLNPVQ